jgi:hypothetical protein
LRTLFAAVKQAAQQNSRKRKQGRNCQDEGDEKYRPRLYQRFGFGMVAQFVWKQQRGNSFGIFASGLLVGHDCACCIDKGRDAARRWMDFTSDKFSLFVISLLFATMFKWLPDAPIDWYDVWLGAIATATLFEIGKSAIAFYIGKQGLESTYGAAASIVVVLIWVYYTSQIILIGAEITHAFAKHHGSIKAREHN